ncbi:MAG: DUF2892 domain-containing protein [Deltaproteobacteria bacterium]|nr:DUF2892 domain-containing protein [Deltaproteobacteria bacterium]
MTTERAVRAFAGIVIILSVGLGLAGNATWFYLTGIVGFMLFQSAFTGFCPAEMIFKKLGVGCGSNGGSCCG